MRCLVALALLAGSTPSLAEGPPGAPPPPGASALLGPAINVADLAATKRFYIDGLGMKQLMQMGNPERYETMLGFPSNPRAPGLILMSDQTVTKAKAKTHGTGFDRLVMRVVDLPYVVRKLNGMGYKASAVRDVAQGYRMAMVTDPDGYRLELVESGMSTEKK